VPGEIHCGDFFDPPAAWRDRFDVVFSFGVVEHFQDTAACLEALRSFLKPGGMIVTVIPNMRGLPGLLQATLDRRVFDIHVPMSREMLAQAHERAGFVQVHAEYFLTINLSALNAECRRSSWYFGPLTRAQSWVSKAVWVVEDATGLDVPNRITSPYVNCIAHRPG
jgi:SAM-dependent methyltransferase